MVTYKWKRLTSLPSALRSFHSLRGTPLRCAPCKIAIFLTLILFSASFEVSADVEKQVKVGSITINFRFKDDLSRQKEEEISQLVYLAFEKYTQLFGGLPRDLEGGEYSDLTLEVENNKFSGGEADPQFIRLSWSEEKVFGYAEWQVVLLHEIFHLWNAESFRHKENSEQWFNEGFTEYYAYKTASQLNLHSPQEALTLLSHPLGFYISSKGLGRISMRDAGKTNKTKFENYFLVYHGGWVVALALDHDIRTRTNGAKSLDDLMAWLYINFPRHDKLYRFNDIITGLRESVGIDYKEFLDSHVAGTALIPVAEYFNLSDATWSFQFNTENKIKYKHLFQSVGIVSNE